ncbi:MAG: hypothetical protein H8E55_57105, partial [Pelagibacterales bacterium]|nr:hypothetical protein [Pelagibacterales bacterium]
MVTSINGNNVTWRDNKTGELITDSHNDLELIMQKGRKRKQNGGNPSNIPRGTGKYGGYQRGGKVKPKPVRRQRGGRTRRQTGSSNGQCGPNQH